MSHLARELDRQLVWIERQTRDLQIAVEQLVSDGNALMSGDELWDDLQAEAIRRAIADRADNCGRSIANAHAEATAFGEQLIHARNGKG